MRIFTLAFLLLFASIILKAQNDTPQNPANGEAQAQPPANQEPGKQKPGNQKNAEPGTQKNAPAPEYNKKQFEVLTGVGAVVSGLESTSYKVDTTNNALSQTNVGRKTVEILLGGGFILPWHQGGKWIEKSFCPPSTSADKAKKPGDKAKPPQDNADQAQDQNKAVCAEGGDPDYKDYRPWETFLSIRFSPATDQTINGFVIGGGYRITKYFSLLLGYSVTPVDEPTSGFRAAASQAVAANPTISPYNRYNAANLLNNKPGAFDGFPLFLYNASGVTTTKLFPTSPLVTHYHSGIYFGVGIPLNLTALFKPSGGK